MTTDPRLLDAFALLGIEPAFELDLDALERSYFERSKRLHPDRFANATAAERIAAMTEARALNDAYKLLRKPTSRAEHLLARDGVTIGDHERLDPAFLMEILEAREQLAEARHAGRLDEIGHKEAAMKARRVAVLDELPALFRDGEVAAVKERLIVLRYLDRYLEECDAALDAED